MKTGKRQHARKRAGQGVRFQPRDADILAAIHENDGVLARRHIQAFFWADKSSRAMERRLSKLQSVGYIAWPSPEDYRVKPVPEPVCWVGWRGALALAGMAGISVTPPKGSNENQLRELQKRLRKAGFRWVREPRWSLLAHDLAIVDFKLAVLRSLDALPAYSHARWLAESVFRLEPDQVVYQVPTRDDGVRTLKKGVCPDAYFEVIDENRRLAGQKHRAPFLLEMDMSTHDNNNFGREKAAAGAAYIRSRAFKDRFDTGSARWLVVTNGGKTRLRNLIKSTRRFLPEREQRWFYFTTMQRLTEANVFTDPVWVQAHRDKRQVLFSGR